jgi:hypothetical protein
VIGRSLLVAAMLGLCAAPVAAQQRPSLLVEVESGSRVRVSTEFGRFVGELLQDDGAGTILLRRPQGDVRIPLAEIVSLQGRGGRDRARGARWGGAILGAITTTGATVDLARGVVGIGEVLSAFAGGALLGAAIRAVVSPVAWVAVPYDGRLRVVPGP